MKKSFAFFVVLSLVAAGFAYAAFTFWPRAERPPVWDAVPTVTGPRVASPQTAPAPEPSAAPETVTTIVPIITTTEPATPVTPTETAAAATPPAAPIAAQPPAAVGFRPNVEVAEAAPAENLEQPLWDLFAEGLVSELNAEIVRMRDEMPEWTPSTELMTQVQRLADTERLLNASASQQDELVLEIVSQTPEVLDCARADTLWAATVAVYREMSSAAGMEMLVQNFSGCITDPGTREEFARRLGEFMSADDIGTVRTQINDSALDAAFTDALVITDLMQVQRWLEDAPTPRYVHAGDDITSDLTTDRPDMIEIRREDASSITTQVPQGVRDARVRLDERRNILEPAQIVSLGWYDYISGNPESAAQIFEESRVFDGASEEILHGEVLARLAYEDYVVAESLVPAHLDGWRTDRVYLLAAADLVAHADRDAQDALYRNGLTITREQAQRIQEAALATQDWDLTEKLGWHGQRILGCEAALPWWRMSYASNAEYEPTAYGIAMCNTESLDTEEMSVIREAWSHRSSRIAMIFGDMAHTALAQRPLPRPSTLNVGTAVTHFGTIDGLRVLTRDEAQALAARMADSAPSPAAPTVSTPAPAPSTPAAPAPRATAAPQQPAPVRTTTAAAPAAAARARAVDACDPAVPLSSLSPSQALERGWCLMEQNNNPAAETAFAAARASSDAQVRADAAYGESLKHLRTGDYMAAQSTLLAEPQETRRRNEIAAGILSAQASQNLRRSNGRVALEALERRQQFAQESPEMMTMRGWALWNSNRQAEARRVWREAADLGDPGARTALREAGR